MMYDIAVELFITSLLTVIQSRLLNQLVDFRTEIDQQSCCPLGDITLFVAGAYFPSRTFIGFPHFNPDAMLSKPPGRREPGDAATNDEDVCMAHLFNSAFIFSRSSLSSSPRPLPSGFCFDST